MNEIRINCEGPVRIKHNQNNTMWKIRKIACDLIAISIGLVIGGFLVAIGFCWGLSLWGAWM